MKSTDHNINNPMDIELLNLNSDYIRNVISVNQYQFDLIDKDPNTIYVVETNSWTRPHLYFGDILIDNVLSNDSPKYLISTSNDHPGEYILYQRCITNHSDHLIKICGFDNPQQAIDTLNQYNDFGSHHSIPNKLVTILRSYIDDRYPINQLLLSMIKTVQPPNQFFNSFVSIINRYSIEVTNNCIDFPAWFRQELLSLKETHPLFHVYSNMYDIIVKYDFFKDKKFKQDISNKCLKPVIEDLMKVIPNRIS